VQGFLRVRKSRLDVGVADLGPMQIQSWEGATLSRADTVLQGKKQYRARGNWLERSNLKFVQEDLDQAAS
jgi:hypothetical protein